MKAPQAWIATGAQPSDFLNTRARRLQRSLCVRGSGSPNRGKSCEPGTLLPSRCLGTVDTFRTAAQLDPWVVWNGYPDGFLIPNHLAAQGFYLLRARTQLREISSILLK